MKKETVGDTGDVYQNITISGGVVGAIGGQGHHIEQTPARSPGETEPPAGNPAPAPAPAYDVTMVRDLLLAAFTAADLRRLFVYAANAELRPAVDDFAEDDGPAAMADKAIQFCQTRDLLPELLAEVERLRPRVYARYRDRLEG